MEANNCIEEAKQKDQEMKEQIEVYKEQIGCALIAGATCRKRTVVEGGAVIDIDVQNEHNSSVKNKKHAVSVWLIDGIMCELQTFSETVKEAYMTQIVTKKYCLEFKREGLNYKR